MKKATLLLSNGSKFEGLSAGTDGCAFGECVFATSMSGYQELITDPARFGQLVCMTYPLIGNYGINDVDFQSHRPWLGGLIIRELCDTPSNWQCRRTLGSYLIETGVVAIAGIDTRQLTTMLRDEGSMNGVIYTEGHEPSDMPDRLRTFNNRDAVRHVTCSGTTVHAPQGTVKRRLALIDCGVRRALIEAFTERGCSVTVVNAFVSASDLASYDGVIVSDGPGNPSDCSGIIESISGLIASGMPLLGIGNGHLLTALALGLTVDRLPCVNGGGVPVTHTASDRTYSAFQLRGYAVNAQSAEGRAEISFVNCNDNSVEGLRLPDKPILTVQFRPEGHPGPRDTEFVFDDFLKLIDKE